MKRRWKVLIGAAVALAVLLALNTFATDRETKDAEVTIEGAEILDLEGGQLQVLDTGPPAAGEGAAAVPPVVLLHCYTCSINWWDGVITRLATERRVVAIDLLGHGGSDKPRSGYSMENQASLVAQVMNQLGVEGAVVVGHSLGGSVATALAEQSSELVDRLVIIGSAPDDSFGELGFLAKLAMTPVLGQALWRVTPDFAIRDGLGEAFAPGYDVPDEFVDDFRRMTFTSYDDSPAEVDDFTGAKPLDQRIAESFVPLLVIFGEEDQIWDAEAAVEAYRQGVPGARTELIPGVGHSPNVEVPERTAELILGFAKPVPVAEIPEPPGEGPGGETVERKAGLRGTLVVRPPVVAPGDTLSVSVRNSGEVKMFYGLLNRIERRAGERWVDATKAVFGTPSPPVRNVILGAAPGKTAGPRYKAVTDEFRLPGDLRPGTYRVVKLVSGPSRGEKPGPSLRLEARFTVGAGP